MKLLSRICNILFALIVLGCFANFAQNEYGLDIILWASLGIAISYFILSIYEINIYRKSQKGKFLDFLFSFSEKISMTLMFCLFVYLFENNPSIIKVMLLFLAQINIPSIIWVKNSILKINSKMPDYVYVYGVLNFLSLPLVYFLFNINAISMIVCGVYIIITVSIITLFHYKFVGKKEFPDFGKYSLSVKYYKSYFATDIMSFFIVGILVLYFYLSLMKVAPEIQTTTRPVAYSTLLKENKKEQAEIYLKNYQSFLENRKNENH